MSQISSARRVTNQNRGSRAFRQKVSIKNSNVPTAVIRFELLSQPLANALLAYGRMTSMLLKVKAVARRPARKSVTMSMAMI
jgi:hypothetical protein